MKKFLCFFFLLTVSSILFAQDSTLVQKTYVRVVKDGVSTAPDFIVINVKDLNNGYTKEICTDMVSLYWSVMQERIKYPLNDFNKYLLKKSKNRNFEFKDTAALKRLEFNIYHLTKSKKINRLIQKNHLRDSLKKIDKIEELLSSEFYKYEDARDSILEVMSDSITKLRPLTDEENKMIKDLHDLYYDKYYTDTIYNKYRTVSAQGEQFMVKWNLKIKKYGVRYSELSKEAARLDWKFFKKYYSKYGLSFCHVAFKNGIKTFIADETGIVSYGGVVE